MRFVLTLIGNPTSSVLDASVVEALHGSLLESGALVGEPDWLNPSIACDLPFDNLTSGDNLTFATAEAIAGERLNDVAIDWAVLETEGRRKGLLVADMESTIIGQEMLDELAEIAGIHAEISAITARTMAGELDFESSLRNRVALLKGLATETLAAVSERITINPGARTLVSTMRHHGAYTALVSGGFSYFTDQVSEACGFDEHQANQLIITNRRLTGTVGEPILGRESKLTALQELSQAHNLPITATCAVGDGANDLAMIQAAGLGVAYHGKQMLRSAARVCIDQGDLTALLYLQGYRHSEFRN